MIYLEQTLISHGMGTIWYYYRPGPATKKCVFSSSSMGIIRQFKTVFWGCHRKRIQRESDSQHLGPVLFFLNPFFIIITKRIQSVQSRQTLSCMMTWFRLDTQNASAYVSKHTRVFITHVLLHMHVYNVSNVRWVHQVVFRQRW